MTQAALCTMEYEPLKSSLWGRFGAILAPLCLYIALWGGLCGMAGLANFGVTPLLFGAGWLFLAAFLPKKPLHSGLLLAAAGILSVLLLLLRPADCLGGAGLLLNRLFAASEAQQAYLYEKFVFVGDEAALQYLLVPLGLLSGALLGAGGRWGRLWPATLLTLLFCGGSAYLGVPPQPGWLVLLALGTVLTLLTGRVRPPLWAVGGALGLLAALTAILFLLFPGESAPLSAWEEGARDALAGHTVAYGEAVAATPPPQLPQTEQSQFYWEEETAGDLGGQELQWSRKMTAWLVILLFALALFLPALFSDWIRRRRGKNRAFLTDPDAAAATRSAFLYALGWLRLGGLPTLNRPYSGYGEALENTFSPQLRRQFEAVLPLWQEAAYSPHPMGEDQRRAMAEFLDAAQAQSWDKLNRWGRFKAKYILAL